jgi:hypothetical protein
MQKGGGAVESERTSRRRVVIYCTVLILTKKERFNDMSSHFWSRYLCHSARDPGTGNLKADADRQSRPRCCHYRDHLMDPTPPMGSLSYQFFPLEAYNDCTFNRATFLFSCVRPASPLTTEPRTVASSRSPHRLHSHPDSLFTLKIPVLFFLPMCAHAYCYIRHSRGTTCRVQHA